MSTAASTFSSLPVLHLPDKDCTPEEETAFCCRLRDICHTVGFFYVINHGIDASTTADAMNSSRAFFALPHDVKQGIANINSPAFRGYVRLGAENTAGRPDWREQIEMGVEADAPRGGVGGHIYDVLVGPNQWPDETQCPGFKTSMTSFLDDMATLSARLMELLAVSLDMPRDYFEDDFRGRPNVQAKIALCPPAPEGSRDPSFGVGAHTDSGYLSLLLQDDVGGLQVQNGDGTWVDADPVDGAIVVNLGEMMQLKTRGVLSRDAAQGGVEGVAVAVAAERSVLLESTSGCGDRTDGESSGDADVAQARARGHRRDGVAREGREQTHRGVRGECSEVSG